MDAPILSSCPHLLSLNLDQPHHSLTRPEECSQCFDSHDNDDGLDICLTCYNAGCPRLHAQAHADKFGDAHSVVINIHRVRKSIDNDQQPTSAKRVSGEPPFKKVFIRAEPPEYEKYNFITKLKCYACGGVEIQGNDKTHNIIQTLLSAMTTARQSEVKSWEQELNACQHTLTLTQLEAKQLQESGLAHCSSCDLNNNLWLCLTCGDLNCGRQQFGGLSGNGHAVAHYSTSQHPVAVKLGTIQADGTADIYCYACDDEKLDPNLAQHLKHFGIQVESQVKTEKSLGELQVEQNMKFDFAMSGEDGKQLEPLFGPGLTGLRNLGNSCYMASVLQAIFALPAFSDRYYTKGSAHTLLCPNPNPATCFECQMAKIADGLLSGRYSHPSKPTSDSNDDETAKAFVSEGSGQTEKDIGGPVQAETTTAFQEGIRPIMFKTLIGKDHPEFSTMRQQDGEEFFKYLVSMIQKSNAAQAVVPGTTLDNEASGDPTDIFKFQMQERLQCTECKGVRYKTVPEESVSMNVPFIEAMPSSSDASSSGAMDIDEKGKSATEGPNASSQEPSASSSKTEYQPVALEECLRLLTNPTTIEYKCPQCNKSVEAEKSTKFATFPETLVLQAKKFTLVNWVPQKVDVPVIVPDGLLTLDEYLGHGKLPEETDLPDDEASSTQIQFNEAAMAQLEAMGFPAIRCQKALLATGNSDPDAAMNWLFSHMEDTDIDDPIPAAQLSAPGSGGPGAGEPSSEAISMVTDMGFTPNQARKALLETSGSMEAAVEWLFANPGDPGIEEGAASASPASASKSSNVYGSAELPANYRLKAFISHKGNSIHVGHYVAHVKVPGVGWVLFNDEKVVKADGGAQSATDLMPYAYLYIFEKVKPDVPA